MADAPKADVVGWKGIADVLGVSEATARRWETLGLPVYNHGPKLVVANRAELEKWMLRRRSHGRDARAAA